MSRTVNNNYKISQISFKDTHTHIYVCTYIWLDLAVALYYRTVNVCIPQFENVSHMQIFMFKIYLVQIFICVDDVHV